ncbi:hypothetical protein [Exiguobacterium sp. s194]|uniref:hypothetical protein n=1 Tax=Exiguobacterium sp. s194 TaxID=2751230 RepID=UPI001BE59409|nr:hypothetical protein [Exiguobacterium sp. s194]
MKQKIFNFVKNNKIMLLIITLWVVALIVGTINWNSNWIGFWGSLIGSFIGVLGVFITMKVDQEEREKERKQDIFISNLSTYIGLHRTLSSTEFSSIYKELLKLKNSKE